MSSNTDLSISIRNLQITHDASPELFNAISTISNSKSRAERIRFLASVGLLLLNGQSSLVGIPVATEPNPIEPIKPLSRERELQDNLTDNLLSDIGV